MSADTPDKASHMPEVLEVDNGEGPSNASDDDDDGEDELEEQTRSTTSSDGLLSSGEASR